MQVNSTTRRTVTVIVAARVRKPNRRRRFGHGVKRVHAQRREAA
jgi:hypothetical protein